MSDTNRNIRGIDTAGQKDLWERPKNPGNTVKAPATKVSGDNRPDTKNAKSLPATKTLN